MRRALSALLFPEGLLILGAAVVVRWPALLAPLEPVLPLLPTFVGATGAVLAIRFRRSGVLFGLLALVAAGASRYATDPGGGLQAAAAALLPVNLLAFALLPDRGLGSPASLRRAAALAAQMLVVFVLVWTDRQDILAPLARRVLTDAMLPPGVPAGDVAALAAAVAMATLGLRLLLRPDPVARGFLWAVGGGLLAFLAPPVREVGGIPAQTFLLTTAALALVVAQIEAAHALAYRDALTELPNRRALDDALRRLDGGFTIAMADVDHFKAVNDTHGHDVGDQILRLVATHLADVGDGGQAYRYGGEEFAILFAGRSVADVLGALEATREAVAAASFTLRGPDRPRRRPRRPRPRNRTERLAVTVSLGVAQRRPDDTTPEAVVLRADGALYRAKERGRNRIVSGEPARPA